MAFLPLAVQPAGREDLPMRIEICVFEGFDEVDAIAPFEVLSNAAALVDDFEVELVGAHGSGEIVAGHGLKIVVDREMSDQADLMIVPGGGWVRGGGVRQQYEDGTLAERLRELRAGGMMMASVCSGSILLAQAGVLDGHPATSHRAALDFLADQGIDIDREARVVDDGEVITCGGVTSGLDLALHLVARFCGADIASGIGTLMEHDVVGPIRVTASQRGVG
jgi:transcriptional regulator GlxA family with amidase domain